MKDEEFVSKEVKLKCPTWLGGNNERSIGGILPRVRKKRYVERKHCRVDLGYPPDYC